MGISSNVVIPGINELQEKKKLRTILVILGSILPLTGLGLIFGTISYWSTYPTVYGYYMYIGAILTVVGLFFLIVVGLGKLNNINNAKRYIKVELEKIQSDTNREKIDPSLKIWENQLAVCKRLKISSLVKRIDPIITVLRQKGTSQTASSISQLKESIHGLSKVYDDISLDSLSEKFNLATSDFLPIIEKMIIEGELNAQIRGQFLIFKQKKQEEVKEIIEHYELDRQVNLFISYSHADSELFHISEISEGLTTYDKIAQVVFSQRDVREDFIQYMNEMLSQSDAILLFCSENSLESKSVKDEWTAAMAARKPVIPIFVRESHIPTLIRGKLGVQFIEKNVPESIEEIYAIITKRLGQVKEHLKLN